MGKSSLINCLLRRKSLARTSKRPGRTREINFYRVNREFFLVDLPGYGFAGAPPEYRQRWAPLMESYLGATAELLGVVQLIDSRHGPTGDDRQMLDTLARLQIPSLFVLTKVDKLSRSERREAVESAREELGVPKDQILETSAVTGEGREELLDSMDALLESAETGPHAGKEGRGPIRPG